MQKMKKDNLPKVLVIGQAFHFLNGGGVTLSNLFKGYDKSRLFSLPFGRDNSSLEVCSNIYVLDYKSRFPIFLWPFINNKSKAQVISNLNICSEKNLINESKHNFPTLRKTLYLLSTILGLDNIFHRYRISTNLSLWLKAINVDLIYAQYSDYASMKFVRAIQKFLAKPMIIHIMDDWILGPPITNTNNSLSKYGIFNSYWRKKNISLFTELLSIACERIAISEDMAQEYKKRFGFEFLWLHNYVDLKEWEPYSRLIENHNNDFVIGYFGTIDIKNKENFIDLIEACKMQNNNAIKIRIFSRDSKMLRSYHEDPNFIELRDNVNLEQYKREISKCSLLFLPLGFSSHSFNYGRLSLPTKLGEYMISKVPILVYAREDSTVYKFCSDHKCAKLVGTKSTKNLRDAIEILRSNSVARYELIANASFAANRYFKKEMMIDKFYTILISVAKKNQIIPD